MEFCSLRHYILFTWIIFNNNIVLSQVSTTPTVCPSNAICPGTYHPAAYYQPYVASYEFETTLFLCNPGYTPNAQNTGCVQCGANKYKFLTSNDVCLTCPTNGDCSDRINFNCKAGYELTPDQTACQQCSSGYFKDTISNGTCGACAVGTAPNDDYSTCTSVTTTTTSKTTTTGTVTISTESKISLSYSSFNSNYNWNPYIYNRYYYN